MRSRNVIALLIAMAMLAASAPMAQAYTLTTGANLGPYLSGTGGGEFTVNLTGFDPLPFYDDKTKNQNGTTGLSNTFQTFCLETNEYIYKNSVYDAVFNNAADNGGVAGGRPDPISKGTAWLYLQFAKGIWGGYNYSVDRTTSAAALQNTIWFLEGEASDPGETNYFRQAVKSQFTTLDNAMLDDDVGIVKVLNLTSDQLIGNTHLRQDVLVVTPIPAAVWLLGAGVIGLVGVRRRMRS